MGIGMGLRPRRAVVSGKPVVAIEVIAPSAFSGMEIETICAITCQFVTVVFNNGGIYRGDDVTVAVAPRPAPDVLMKHARYDKLIEALAASATMRRSAGARRRPHRCAGFGEPALINCADRSTAGTESGTSAISTRQSSVAQMK